MPGHAFVRIPAGEQRSAKWTAERKTGDRARAVQTNSCHVIQVRGMQVRVAIAAEGLAPMLVAKDPDGIGLFGIAQGLLLVRFVIDDL